MIQPKPMPEILVKYPVVIPVSGNKWDQYRSVKDQFFRRYGWVDPREYDAFIEAITDVLGL